MTRHQTMLHRLTLTATVSVIVFFSMFAGEAQASCFGKGRGLVVKALPYSASTVTRAADDDPNEGAATLVGLWRSEYLIGKGPDLFDEAFQQFHSDGTEMMLSRGLPPVLGNVCVGIWKQTGPRTFKLKHTAWNWTVDGAWTGTFVMEATITLSRSGARFSGTWSADNFDTLGAPIPGQHFEGVARGTRIRCIDDRRSADSLGHRFTGQVAVGWRPPVLFRASF